MSGSLNQAQIIGHLGRDPEVRTTQNGTKCANLNVATSESWKDKATGERKESTEWHRVVIWGAMADVAEKYAKKGSKVFIQGQLKTRKWTDKDGAERYTTEIVVNGFGDKLTLLDRANNSGPPPATEQPDGPSRPRPGPPTGPRDEFDDDIPF